MQLKVLCGPVLQGLFQPSEAKYSGLWSLPRFGENAALFQRDKKIYPTFTREQTTHGQVFERGIVTALVLTWEVAGSWNPEAPWGIRLAHYLAALREVQGKKLGCFQAARARGEPHPHPATGGPPSRL
jgi:hypothetical protein